MSNLKELSAMYAAQSEALKQRLREVAALEVSDAELHQHTRRLRLLRDMQQEAGALATLTRRYYDRSYRKGGRYAL
jgi:hypothetical protein